MWVLKARGVRVSVYCTCESFSHVTVPYSQTDWQTLLLCHCDVNFTGRQLLQTVCVLKCTCKLFFSFESSSRAARKVFWSLPSTAKLFPLHCSVYIEQFRQRKAKLPKLVLKNDLLCWISFLVQNILVTFQWPCPGVYNNLPMIFLVSAIE